MKDEDKAKEQLISELMHQRQRIAELEKAERERNQVEDVLLQQSEFLEILLETIPNPIFYKGIDGKYTGCNRAFEKFLGRPRQEIIGKTVYDMGPEEIADKYSQKDKELFDHPGEQHYEWRVQRKDGEIREVIFDKAAIMHREGYIEGLIGVMSDITDRKRADAELERYRDHLEELVKERTAALVKVNEQLTREIQERKKAEEVLERHQKMLQKIIDESHTHLVYLDRDFNFVVVNATYAQSCHRAPEELIGKNHFHFYPNEENEAIFRRVRETGQSVSFHDKPFTFPDQPERGTTYWDWTLSPVKNESNDVEGLVFSLVETTERKRIEEAIRNAKKQWEGTFDAISDWVCLIDEDQNIIRSNKSAGRFCGYSFREIIGKRCYEIVHGINKAVDDCPARRVFKSGRREEMEFQAEDGRWLHVSVEPAGFSHNNRELFVHIVRDMTERKRTEEALRESQVWLDLALRSAHMGTWHWDLTESRRYFDDQACLLLGSELARSTVDVEEFFGMVHPDDQEKIRTALAQTIGQDTPYQPEYRVIWPDGSVRHISARGSLVRDAKGRALRLNGIIWDITERKRDEEERKLLEDRLQQVRKAESLGRMAGAIAHHFNNLLGAVMGNLELAMFDLPQGSEPRVNIAEAMKASRRASEISGLMLAYLGQSIATRVPIELSEVCRYALPLLTSSLPEKVHLKMEFLDPGPVIRADGVQIRQVLTNLVVNAVEAMGEGEGQVNVTVHEMPGSDIRASRFYPPEWEPKEESYACLSVSDTGTGMDQDMLEKAFDPFFSTKFTGRGLGLAVVLGVAKAHEGALTVESAPGRGTVFRVFLPLTAQELKPPQEAEPAVTVSPKDRNLVLLVDDEPMLRDIAQTMLQRLGYEVIMANDGVEALGVFREHQDHVQCVLLDLTMPRMDGWETLAALRALRSALPVILASGYDEAQVMQSHHPERPQAFLHKPYGMKDLEKALGAVLTASSDAEKGASQAGQSLPSISNLF